MIQEDQEDKRLARETAPEGAGLTPNVTEYDAYKAWANPEPNYGISPSQMDAGLPPDRSPMDMTGGGSYSGEQSNKVSSRVDEMLDKAKQGEDTNRFSYNTKDVSPRYRATFKGIDNESLYAANQTTGEKAYNGVAKMVGIAGSTFINGTAGTVYGLMKWGETGKPTAFYDNDLSNYLSNFNTEWEDKYAHYKTERERNGEWYEPSNLFTANFLFDNVVKNLGFSLGAMGSGFAWGAALKAIGLTATLMGTGAKWASAAESAISEATALPAAQRLSTIGSRLNQLINTSKVGVGGALMKADRGIVAAFGTFGEAGMEALNNSQQFRQQLIQEYKNKYGADPEGRDLEEINQNADAVGKWSFGLNSALLTATNYIQLPKIYSSSFRGERAIANNIARAGEEYVSTLPTKGFGKVMHGAKNLIGLGLNGSEGFEEGAQFAIQTLIKSMLLKNLLL